MHCSAKYPTVAEMTRLSSPNLPIFLFDIATDPKDVGRLHCFSNRRNLSYGSRASLNKLAIRGIRSFDDKHVQVIEFYSPLTVIVGHNGSGKTVSLKANRAFVGP